MYFLSPINGSENKFEFIFSFLSPINRSENTLEFIFSFTLGPSYRPEENKHNCDTLYSGGCRGGGGGGGGRFHGQWHMLPILSVPFLYFQPLDSLNGNSGHLLFTYLIREIERGELTQNNQSALLPSIDGGRI